MTAGLVRLLDRLGRLDLERTSGLRRGLADLIIGSRVQATIGKAQLALRSSSGALPLSRMRF